MNRPSSGGPLPDRDAEYRRALGIGNGPLPKTLGTISGRGRSARRASKPRLITRAPDTSACDGSGRDD